MKGFLSIHSHVCYRLLECSVPDNWINCLLFEFHVFVPQLRYYFEMPGFCLVQMKKNEIFWSYNFCGWHTKLRWSFSYLTTYSRKWNSVLKWQTFWTAASKWVSSKSSGDLTFTFRQIFLGRVGTPLPPPTMT